MNNFVGIARKYGHKVFLCGESLCVAENCHKGQEVETFKPGRIEYPGREAFEEPLDPDIITKLKTPCVLTLKNGTTKTFNAVVEWGKAPDEHCTCEGSVCKWLLKSIE